MLKLMFKTIVLFLFTNILFTSCLKSNDIRQFLGTRTPYRYKYNKNDSHISYPHCKDTKIWMIIRHGTRLPNAKVISGMESTLVDLKYEILLNHNMGRDCKDTKIWMIIRHGTRLPNAKVISGMESTLVDLKYEILLNHNMGRGNLSKEQQTQIEKWSSNLDVEKEKHLALEGEDEMVLLAERMRNRFPNAIKNKYSNDSFTFRYTATQRAQQSARHFTIGLFNRKHAQGVLYEPATKIDPILRFYKHCDRWLKQVKRNESTYKQQEAFEHSPQMQKALADVSQKLGFKEPLNLDKVSLMYKTCGYETAWHKQYVSPWCYGFDADSAKALEYYYDLKHYWVDGYGHELTYRQACLAIKNVFAKFSNKDPPLATFFFAHSGTLLKVLSHLQLYKPDSHLMGDVIREDRTWKTSNIDCFASNLAFVLYKCDDGDRLLTLHQEQIVKLPMCEEELCPFETLKSRLQDSILNCDYSDMCRLD